MSQSLTPHVAKTPDQNDLKYAQFFETAFAAIALTGLSDWLLFGAPIGLSLVLFAFALGGTTLWLHRFAAGTNKIVAGAAGYTIALLPLLENISGLSLAVSLVLFSAVSLWLANEWRGNLYARLGRFLAFVISAPFAAPIGFMRWRKAARTLDRPMLRFATIGVWIMPVVVGLMFLGLFEEANPLIADWIVRIDFWAFLALFDPARFAFWLFILAVSWPFLSPIVSKAKPPRAQRHDYPRQPKTLEDILFGKDAILRALIVFNALFAVQSLLDATFLIGGARLPDNMTLAQYAHRGAYPLVVTALMAALFVILALREGSQAKQSRLIRTLVYMWIFQNVLLVLSSVYRLDLYVQSYALTYMRVAAFIWMGLIATGLVLIVARLVLNKSSEWLVGTNLAIAGIVLYTCCFVNFGDMIARNILAANTIDSDYVIEMGAPAIPAVDYYLKSGENQTQFAPRTNEPDARTALRYWRDSTTRYFIAEMVEWRAWTLRSLRLQSYLKSNPVLIDSPLSSGAIRP